MVEYTRKILNSCCDLDILKSHIDKLVNEIIRAVVNKRRENIIIECIIQIILPRITKE